MLRPNMVNYARIGRSQGNFWPVRRFGDILVGRVEGRSALVSMIDSTQSR